MRLFGPLVYQWCRRQGLQSADAADVGQEVFRTVAAKIGSFHRDRPGDTFRGWLWTITRSKAVDHWRQQGEPRGQGGTGAQQCLAEVPEQEPEPFSGRGERPNSLSRRALQLVQAEFEDTTWRAFWMVVVDRRSPAEAASELGLSVNAVYLAKSRVLRRLREELGELLE